MDDNEHCPDIEEDELEWPDDVVLTPPPPKEQYRVHYKVIKIERVQ